MGLGESPFWEFWGGQRKECFWVGFFDEEWCKEGEIFWEKLDEEGERARILMSGHFGKMGPLRHYFHCAGNGMNRDR